MEWISTLYKDTRDLWIKNGSHPSGYAIFYSPVIVNPRILIIGYNPGGDNTSFTDNIQGPPDSHEYITQNYRMAERMRYIFEAAGLLQSLETSVKTNLIYFRTKNSAQVDTSLNDFFYRKMKLMIDKISPGLILAEGFKTFECILEILGISLTDEFRNTSGKTLMKYADFNGLRIIGIPHPTGARGFTNENRNEIGRLIAAAIK